MVFGRKISPPRIVQPGAERRHWWLLVLALLALLLAGVGVIGPRWCPELDTRAVQAETALLRQQVSALEGERAELRQEVARLARASQIDQAAAVGLRDELKTLQEERLKLEQEATFLRRVVSDGTGGEALQVKDFSLAAQADKAVFRYHFVISQARGRASAMSGKILIGVEGVQDGKARTLTLKNLSAGKLEFVKMRFKSFQDVDGLLRLPDGFTPERVRVDIQPEDQAIPPLSQSFAWTLKD